MGKIAFIFCEDYCHEKIIDKIISHPATSSNCDFRIIKTGGVRGQNAFTEGFLARGGASKSDVNIIFRDRDFDFEISDTASLRIEKKENKTICTLYRVTAENYLLSPELLGEYSRQTGKNVSDSDFSSFLDSAARRIAAYSAARHTLAFFRDNYSFRTSWTPQSGKLPENFEPDFCITKAWKLIDEKQGKLCPINKQTFLDKFDSFLSRFDENFFQAKQYMIWFNGKDLESSFCQLIPAELRISMEAYYRFALEKFEFGEYPELLEFQEFLNQA